MQYLVSRHEHKVEQVIGNSDDLRIMWMFGWYVDGDQWKLDYSNFNMRILIFGLSGSGKTT